MSVDASGYVYGPREMIIEQVNGEKCFISTMTNMTQHAC